MHIQMVNVTVIAVVMAHRDDALDILGHRLIDLPYLDTVVMVHSLLIVVC